MTPELLTSLERYAVRASRVANSKDMFLVQSGAAGPAMSCPSSRAAPNLTDLSSLSPALQSAFAAIMAMKDGD